MKKLNGTQRKLLAIYIIWIFIHLVFLTISEKTLRRKFWPFQTQDYSDAIIKAYDLSEFLVYAIGPGIVLLAYLLFNKKD